MQSAFGAADKALHRALLQGLAQPGQLPGAEALGQVQPHEVAVDHNVRSPDAAKDNPNDIVRLDLPSLAVALVMRYTDDRFDGAWVRNSTRIWWMLRAAAAICSSSCSSSKSGMMPSSGAVAAISVSGSSQ